MGVCGIGQTFYTRRQDWSNLLWEWSRLVKPSAGADEIVQECLQEQVGLVKLSEGADRIGHLFCRSQWDHE